MGVTYDVLSSIINALVCEINRCNDKDMLDGYLDTMLDIKIEGEPINVVLETLKLYTIDKVGTE